MVVRRSTCSVERPGHLAGNDLGTGSEVGERTDDGIVISLVEQHSFPLSDVFGMLRPGMIEPNLVQAALVAPMFTNSVPTNPPKRNPPAVAKTLCGPTKTSI